MSYLGVIVASWGWICAWVAAVSLLQCHPFHIDMLILVVNSVTEDAKGEAIYRIFLKLLKKLFASSAGSFQDDYHYMERRCNELGDIVVDWEYDHLDKKAQENSIRFDRVDVVVVYGDLSTLPWEPSASQVVTLIHMAKYMNKPYLGIGFGALTAIYTFATKGARFNVLNGPYGQSIEDLPSFPHYSISTGAVPSGWLDRETGDIYTYDRTAKEWRPTCNVGIHFTASKGSPGSPRGQPPARKHISYDDMANPLQPVYRQDGNHEAIRFAGHSLNPFLLAGIPTNSHHFIVDQYPEWYINREGSLPVNEELILIAESKQSPVVFLRKRMLLLACKVESADHHRTVSQLLSNYIQHILDLCRSCPTDKIELSMNDFLFGNVEMSHGKYDSLRDRHPMTIAQSRLAIPTTLKAGPVRVDPPLLEMFIRTSTKDTVDYFALTGKRRSSSVGRRPRQTLQNPLTVSVRKKRIDGILDKLGMTNNTNAVEQGLIAGYQSNPFAAQEHMSEMTKELLTGRVMKDYSVTSRRHHGDLRSKILSFEEISALDYAKIFPPTPKSAMEMNLQLPALVDEAEAREMRTPRVTFSGGNEGVRSPSPPQPSSREQTSRQGSAVPVIADWNKVFTVPNQASLLNPEVLPLASPSRSSRSPRSAAMTGTVNTINVVPWSPQPSSQPSAPTTPRVQSSRCSKSPRSARSILHEAVTTHYLPLHRPQATMTHKRYHFKHDEPECSSDEEDEENEDGYEVVEMARIPEEVIVVQSPRGQSNYLALSQTFKANDAASSGEYQSYYVTGYLSPQEALMMETKQAKQLHLAGEFKTHFNRHKTAMAPRPEGCIRSEGPYPAPPDFGFPPEVKAIEWPFMCRTGPQDKEKWVAGAWKR